MECCSSKGRLGGLPEEGRRIAYATLTGGDPCPDQPFDFDVPGPRVKTPPVDDKTETREALPPARELLSQPTGNMRFTNDRRTARAPSPSLLVPPTHTSPHRVLGGVRSGVLVEQPLGKREYARRQHPITIPSDSLLLVRLEQLRVKGLNALTHQRRFL